MSLTKLHLIEALERGTDLTKQDAREVLDDLLELVKQSLEAGAEVKISGFGVFQAREKRARQGRNPITGEPMEIRARRVVTFKPSQKLRAALNGRELRVTSGER